MGGSCSRKDRPRAAEDIPHTTSSGLEPPTTASRVSGTQGRGVPGGTGGISPWTQSLCPVTGAGQGCGRADREPGTGKVGLEGRGSEEGGTQVRDG